MPRVRIETSVEMAAQARLRACDHPGCAAAGDFRAPRSRASLGDYFWFCLDHVRAYNAAWNYYAGMSEAEIEAEIRHDTTWQRPSWPFGSRYSAVHGSHVRDGFGFFEEGGEAAGHEPAKPRPLSAQEAALQIFGIEPPFTLVRLKARYKELVKAHHPDAHGGDKAAEEKLKAINQAYATLKSSYFS